MLQATIGLSLHVEVPPIISLFTRKRAALPIKEGNPFS
jgi:hypothetical protein